MAVTNVNLTDTLSTFVTKTNTIATELGDLATLTTGADSSIVAAINSLDSDFRGGASLDTLTTTSKTFVGAINELQSEVLALDSANIGSLSTLNTDEQGSVVGAINELDSSLDSLNTTLVTRIRSSLSVSGDLSYNSSTGVFSTSGLASSTTDDLAEGSSNLYHTSERVDDRVNALLQEGSGITLTYSDSANTLTIAGAAQYADSDARNAISVTASTGLSYTASTGVLAGVNATTTVKGVAKFSSTNFTTSSGTVSIKNDGVARANLKDEVELIIYNSSGTAVKTLYGAGS